MTDPEEELVEKCFDFKIITIFIENLIIIYQYNELIYKETLIISLLRIN